MKKFKFLGIAVCVLLFVFAAGCQNEPQELIHRTELHSLPGPDGLEAKVYDGMIILQWNNVPNASSYRVVRKDTSTKLSVVRATVSNTTSNAISYTDTVGWDNQLINDRDYEYSVISVSSSTTVVQNGESKITVKARIPNPSEFTPSLDADQIDVTQYTTITGVDQIVVTFPNQPNYQYQVAYTYGLNEIVRDFESFNNNNTAATNWFDPVKAATFPAIGGANSVSVKAWFTGDQSYYGGNTVATKPATVAIATTLNQVNNFQALRLQDGSGVRLSWSDLADATGYRIYRAQVSGSTSSPIQQPNDNRIITVSGDWVPVTATQSQGLVNGMARWIAYDTDAGTGHHIYAIIAEGDGGAKSAPVYVYQSNFDINDHQLVVTIPNANNYPRRVQIYWYTQVDTAYTLEYAEVQNITNPTLNATSTNYYIVGSFSNINIPPAAIPATPGEQATVYHDFTPTQDARNYIFRLTATHSNGVSETYLSYNILNSGAFSKTVAFSITATNNASGNVRLAITDGATFRGRDYTIQVYRRITTAGSETDYVSIGQKMYTSYDTFDSPDDSWTFDDNNVTVFAAAPYQEYQYKIVVDGFANTHTSGGQSQAVTVWY